MYKHGILLIIFLLSSAFTFQVNGQEPNDRDGDIRYISDDLFTFLHAGPGRNYRILGSLVAGTRITVLQEDKEKEFIEIIDDNQRTGWVESQYVNKVESIRVLLPGLQKQLQDTTQVLQQQSTENDLLNQQIAALTSQNLDINRKLKTLESENTEITQELANQDYTEKMAWFTRGGIIAVISLLLGIVLTYLPKKRRRNDNWM
jgi:SH3 domain protein